MASGNTFLSLAASGIKQLLTAISSFTGNANEIVSTDGSGLIDVSLTNAVLLTTNQTVNGEKTFVDNIFIDDPTPSDALEIGYFNNLTPNDPNTYGVRRTGLSGYFAYMSNATFPQFIIGSPSGGNTGFVDVTENGTLNINVLDTGPNDPGPVNFGIGGVTILGSSELAPTNPFTVFRDDTVPILSFQVESDGTLTTGTTTSYEALVLADNDIPNKIYTDTRDKMTFPACRNASLSTDQALRRQNGTFIDACPYSVPYDGEIYAVTAENNSSSNAQSWELQVEINGVVSAPLTTTVGVGLRDAQQDGLSVSISQGDDIVIFFRNASGAVANPGGIVYARRTGLI